MYEASTQILRVLLFISIVFIQQANTAMIYLTSRQTYRANQLDTFLMRDLYDCHDKEMLSIREEMLQIFICIHKQTSHCTNRRQNKYMEKRIFESERHIYCEMIASESMSSQLSTLDTYFTSIKGYLMYFNILIFDFEWYYLGCYKHGLTLISSDTAAHYCFSGKRLPWTIIFDARHAVMKLRATLPYRITLFYSLNKINWLINFSQQLYVYLDKDLSYNIPFFSPTHVFDINIYNLYVRSHPMDRIVFIIKQHQPFADLKFYDGPGMRSKRLFEFRKNIFFTSGFLGFIHFVQKQNNDLILIALELRPRRTTVPSCFSRTYTALPRTIFSTSSQNLGQICFCMFHRSSDFLRLNVTYFVYKGTRAVYGLGDCQYGGLFIEQLTMTEICENRFNYVIYGESLVFKMLLVWYSGYSYGHIEAELQEEPCITKYLTRNNYLKYNKVMIKDNSIYCQRVLCIVANKCKFHIQGFNKPIGVARIKVGKLRASHLCLGQHNVHIIEHNVSALHSDDWPLKEPKLSHYISTNQSMIYEFKFLNDVNISLRFTCDPKIPQNGIILEKSTCYKDSHNKLSQPRFLLNAIDITSDCFIANITTNSSTDFVYIVGGVNKMYPGLQIKIRYFSWGDPMCSTCSSYNYTFTVQQKHTVTRHVGEIILQTPDEIFMLFPGYYYNSFNLSIIKPRHRCKCAMSVDFHEHKYPVGTYNGTAISHGIHEWHIHPKRYLLAFRII